MKNKWKPIPYHDVYSTSQYFTVLHNATQHHTSLHNTIHLNIIHKMTLITLSTAHITAVNHLDADRAMREKAMDEEDEEEPTRTSSSNENGQTKGSTCSDKSNLD